ncbi:unnamed protein product [Microthlaspi erraticum]|uniref:Uncharacterized protein n=1 Tax=Microthlaspi erraticum TaxID=1685480 RepID=A0A6D2JZJ0_9BRAS|nr:unnamed protein product [Microthlaspi erraticum]
MSQPKTSGRSSFGFMMRPLTWLCMCFNAAAEGDQRRRSNKKLLRRSRSVHSMKPSPVNSFDRSPMVDDEERDEKIKDVILYWVILMEMITGRTSNDETLSEEKQNLVMWLRPSLDRNIPKDEATVESIKTVAKLAEHCTFQDVDKYIYLSW